MPVQGFLSKEQKERLQKALNESEKAGVRQRCLMLLLMNDGKTYDEISEFIGCGKRTVVYWCVHGDPDNLESLKDKRENGNYRKATEKYQELLMEIIEKEPEEYGYKFGRWTTERLARHLEKETGIQLSGEQVRRILKQKKYSYHWAKYSLEDKQDPAKRKIFKEKLAEYLTISKKEPNKLQVWFWDESGFSLRVIRRKNWGKKGTRRKVTGQRRQGRVNVMGGLRFNDKKRWCYFVKRGNSESFYEALEAWHKEVKKDWIEQGGVAEEFAEKGIKIILVLDNASYHKKKTMIAELEQNLPNIIFCFLPPYSPDYNLIELVWHSAKEYLAHRLFQSVKELEDLLDKLLNQGELVIQWSRKIKNKGNAFIAT